MSEIPKLDLERAVEVLKREGLTREAVLLQRMRENMVSSRQEALRRFQTVGGKQ